MAGYKSVASSVSTVQMCLGRPCPEALSTILKVSYRSLLSDWSLKSRLDKDWHINGGNWWRKSWRLLGKTGHKWRQTRGLPRFPG
ncbi:hypothetical protein BDW74DRAFT_154310 [Aspergillus multicolor]|uniref:uncharacterized protein n=1 Tax=Aspergillus multicolor TaxID=41759 RepID=UPI003CCD5F60